ncbi:hypothetical protein BGZ65_006914 [Modicella reniformis]|uniref:C2 domain-containing protein n=1 Tax=Modicella reniformis TaxID=1440133 RepID=A0A9P6M899_9FUNG|nr:hypothetical protein BGZ65_006914 [Modicella reniformis]
MVDKSIHIHVTSAAGLDDVERFGKNDPYASFTLDLNDKSAFKKTSVKKNAGRHAEWNEVVILNNYDPSRHRTLYVDVMDDEKLADEPIGFASIPLYQAADAPNKSFKGKFDLFNDKNKHKGFISLTITIIETSRSGENITNSNPEVKGESQADSDHQKHIKKLIRLEHASDAATLAAGAALVFGAKNLLGGDKKKE